MASNVPNIYQALDYLSEVIKTRLQLFFDQEDSEAKTVELPTPVIYDDDSNFTQFIQKRQPSFEEYIIFLM
ncbi:MAG: hypothetical protein AAFP19_25235, partial [Bacteroidota bacterium]